MDKYEQSAQTWNSLAKIYEEKFMHLDYYNESYDTFCELVGKDEASILETGSWRERSLAEAESDFS